MTHLPHDIHERVLDEIDERIGALQSGAVAQVPDGRAWSTGDFTEQLDLLTKDRELLLAHWKLQDGLVPATHPPRARECGQPQPCPHVLGV